MQWYSGKQPWKYLFIEVIFFVVLFYLFPILSYFDYNFIELHQVRIIPPELLSLLYYGIFNVLASVIYYKLIQRYLFNHRFATFALITILYLVAYHFYRSGIYYVTAHAHFLPESLQNEAARWYNAHNRVNFSIVYMCTELLCIIALAYFIRSMKQEEQVKTLKEQQLISELNYLKAQLHPHFFFNTINNIYSLALKQSADTAPMVAHLGEMMRYILYEADQKTVLLSREVSFIKNYIAVEQLRHKDKKIEFDIQGIIGDKHIEPLLLLPFIENAFKHGLEQETGAGFVNIVLCIGENDLTMEIVNSKPAEQESSFRGLGLQNVLKRLIILYPDNHQLNINDEADKYYVSLTLQMP